MAETVTLRGADDVLAMLRALPPELVSKRGGPVKTALRKGARVILKQWKANLQASLDPELSSGILEKNLVATRGKPPTDGKGERYLVRARRKGYGRGDVTTLKTLQLKEYGSSKQPAEPTLRPAFASKAEEAIHVTTAEVVRGVEAIAARHLKK